MNLGNKKPLYLGLDCGGSTSRALLIDDDDNVVFQGRSGPANISSTPRPYLAMSIKRALDGCPKPDFACGCFAGLITDEHRRLLEKMLYEFLPGCEVQVYSDLVAALAATKDEDACSVIAGTGSTVSSWVNGELRKSGGGGILLGDEGSAFSVGRSGLKHYVRRKGEFQDNLSKSVPALFGVTDPSEIVARVYSDLTPAARIALLADAIAKDYNSCEEYAQKIVHNEMSTLAGEVARHLERYHPEQKCKPIYLAGGLWEISPVFMEVFKKSIEAQTPCKVEVRILKSEPVLGAALLAKKMNHGTRKP